MNADRQEAPSRIRNLQEQLLSDDWFVLKKTCFDFQRRDGSWQRQCRETYDRGNGAVLLPYNSAQKTVLLLRQFRFPTLVNGNPEGMLGPVNTIFPRCVADQKGHAQGAKRSRGLPPARLCNAAHGLFGCNPKGKGWKQRHSSLRS